RLTESRDGSGVPRRKRGRATPSTRHGTHEKEARPTVTSAEGTSHEGQEVTGLPDERAEAGVAEAAEATDSADTGESTGSTQETTDADGGDTGEAEESSEEPDPVEELRAALRRAPGEWYVVHSY